MKVFTRRAINNLQSIAVFSLLLLITYLLGSIFFDSYGIWIVATVLIVTIIMMPRISPDIVIKTYHAKRLFYNESPYVFNAIEFLQKKSGLKNTPKIYYIPSNMFIMFSTGTKDNSSIAISSVVFQYLNKSELLAVLAHEISHIVNNDIWIMQIADVISRVTNIVIYTGLITTFTLVTFFILNGYILIPNAIFYLIFLVPVINLLLQLLLSRTREYAADFDASYYTHNPLALASALKKIDDVETFWVNRFVLWDKKEEPSFLRTHPPTKKRVEKLLEIASELHDENGDHSGYLNHNIENLHLKQPRRYYSLFGF